MSWPPSANDDLITGYQVYANGEPQFATPQAGNPSRTVLRHVAPGTMPNVTEYSLYLDGVEANYVTGYTSIPSNAMVLTNR